MLYKPSFENDNKQLLNIFGEDFISYGFHIYCYAGL